MTMILDPNQTCRFMPPGEEAKAEDRRTVYLLKAPTVWDRIALKRALGARGARQHSALAMCAALSDGVRAIYGEDVTEQGAGILTRIDALREEIESFGRRVLADGFDLEDPAERQAFTESVEHQAELNAELTAVSDIVAQGYPRYARMLSDNEAYELIHALEAARLFLAGWENGPGAFRRDPDGVPEPTLAVIPPHHLLGIGAEVARLMRPTETESKNSDSPSSSGSRPAASTAASSTGRTTPSKTTPGRSPRSAGRACASTPST
ncbi:MAG: hypothetical protein AB7P12_00715 [Alphaproteobacteria bacterium]